MSDNKYAVAGPNFQDYITCPYDSAHRIRPSRFTLHLICCSKNFPSSKKVRCPFNTAHVHSVFVMKDHVAECPDRSLLERYKLPDMLPPVEPRQTGFLIETDEDWDAEPPVATYDPQAYCERTFVIRNPQGNPPAARRAFRKRENKRFTGKDGS
ncbi:gametocyte-specific factor 1 homolog [Drosophila takahashii]|uniref:gametocyte-specific factor 1 homolog n=1 Tax=Drosophila takahashii TaxID=29030 RepID=UPI001CF8ED9A|nr:gametocyte-specific factor 1 homolog [Drosophila takahashii]